MMRSRNIHQFKTPPPLKKGSTFSHGISNTPQPKNKINALQAQLRALLETCKSQSVLIQRKKANEEQLKRTLNEYKFKFFYAMSLMAFYRNSTFHNNADSNNICPKLQKLREENECLQIKQLSMETELEHNKEKYAKSKEKIKELTAENGKLLLEKEDYMNKNEALLQNELASLDSNLSIQTLKENVSTQKSKNDDLHRQIIKLKEQMKQIVNENRPKLKHSASNDKYRKNKQKKQKIHRRLSFTPSLHNSDDEMNQIDDDTVSERMQELEKRKSTNTNFKKIRSAQKAIKRMKRFKKISLKRAQSNEPFIESTQALKRTLTNENMQRIEVENEELTKTIDELHEKNGKLQATNNSALADVACYVEENKELKIQIADLNEDVMRLEAEKAMIEEVDPMKTMCDVLKCTLSEGIFLRKYNKKGKYSYRRVKIDFDGGLVDFESGSLQLKYLNDVYKGIKSKVFEKAISKKRIADNADSCISLVFPSRTLDLQTSNRLEAVCLFDIFEKYLNAAAVASELRTT